MLQREVIQEFADAVQNAENEIAFAGVANRLAQALDYRWFTYLSVGDGKPEALSTYPLTWSEHYFAERYENVDPVVAASRAQAMPFFWGDGEATQPVERDARRLFDDAASFGIVRGLTVPLSGPNGRVALFTLSTDEKRSTSPDRADAMKLIAQLCGLRLHNGLCSRVERFMPDHVRGRALTARQRTCLAAAAEGHSAKEVARLVRLTPRTVQHHFDEARRRLRAESLPHAIAIALRCGEIA